MDRDRIGRQTRAIGAALWWGAIVHFGALLAWRRLLGPLWLIISVGTAGVAYFATIRGRLRQTATLRSTLSFNSIRVRYYELLVRPILGRVLYIIESTIVFAAIGGVVSWIPRIASGQTTSAIVSLFILSGVGVLWGVLGYGYGRDKAQAKLNLARCDHRRRHY